MIKKISSPPVIILLDLLFMLLFILLVSQKNHIKVTIPSSEIFKTATLIYKDSDGISYVMNQNTKEKESIFYSSLDEEFYYYHDCEAQCREYPSKYKGHLYIYFSNELFNKISKLTFIASHTSYHCNKIDFKVKLDGTLDIKKMTKNNSCLNKINGIENLFQN